MAAGLKPASASPDSTCASCSKTQADLGVPLKKCGGCKTTLYCSTKCQDATRKAHKPECQKFRAGGFIQPHSSRLTPAPPPTKAAPPAAPPRPLGPPHPLMPVGGQARSLMDLLDNAGITVSNPQGNGRSTFIPTSGGTAGSATALANLSRSASSNAYLSGFTEREAMRQLIDCFRLRCEDEYKFNGQTVGLYNDEDPVEELNKFLSKAEENKVVPAWWSAARRAEVVRIAQDEEGQSSIQKVLEKTDVIQAYRGDAQMPMKLRGLAERVYGTPVIRG